MFFIYVTYLQLEKDNISGLDNGRYDTVDARNTLRTVREKFSLALSKTQKIAG